MAQTLLQTPLHDRHVALGARLVPFAGWEMPVQYQGVIQEHRAVRTDAGVFDVSHMGELEVEGPRAHELLQGLLSNDLDRLDAGDAQYTLLTTERGGIVDDLIAYFEDDEHVLLVPNAANSAEVARRLTAGAPEGVRVLDHHRQYAVLAVQGTNSDEVLDAVGFPSGHEYMSFAEVEFEDSGVVVCRTGYTGERGYELIARNEVAGSLWDRLLEAGTPFGMLPCGLGARDTLRTEMGYPLHGQDITLDVTPNQAGLGWAVGWKKDAFWGRDVLLKEKESGPQRRLRGLLALERGIPRPGMLVSLVPDVPLCEITSGTYSPTLRKGIGMALVPTFVDPEAELGVQIRTRREIFASTKLPFVDTSVRES